MLAHLATHHAILAFGGTRFRASGRSRSTRWTVPTPRNRDPPRTSALTSTPPRIIVADIIDQISRSAAIAKQSAGILLYRIRDHVIEVLLAHPGGPFWARKDDGVWSIPKGEFTDDEPAISAAKREFEEETGKPVTGELLPLTPITQSSGKVVHAWAVEGDFEPAGLASNTFSMEWPPRSGKMKTFPEIDRVEWFTLEDAKRKINPSQIALLDELAVKPRQRRT
jgi:predicted NUDIX family NTP pyrophosphohydrolase